MPKKCIWLDIMDWHSNSVWSKQSLHKWISSFKENNTLSSHVIWVTGVYRSVTKPLGSGLSQSVRLVINSGFIYSALGGSRQHYEFSIFACWPHHKSSGRRLQRQPAFRRRSVPTALIFNQNSTVTLILDSNFLRSSTITKAVGKCALFFVKQS